MRETRTFVELFSRRVASSGEAPALRYRAEDRWTHLSWGEWAGLSRRVAAGLLVLGLQPRERVGVLGGSCVEWILADVAVQMAGAVTAAVHGEETAARCGKLLGAARCRFVFAEDVDTLAKLVLVKDKLPAVEKVIVLRPDAASRVPVPEQTPERTGALLAADRALGGSGGPLADWVVRFDELTLAGAEALVGTTGGALETRAAALAADDVSTVVYTCGTGGEPRGVLTTHGAYLAAVHGLCQALPIEKDDLQLLTFPLTHIRGLLAYRTSVASGAAAAIWQGPQKLAEDLRTVRPTFLTASPHLCEKIFSRILSQARERGGIEQALLHWALSVGRQWMEARQSGVIPGRLLALKHRGADQLALRRIREVFGGRLRFLIASGAPLRRDIAEFLTVAGIPVLESYGLTESAGIAFVNRPTHLRLGTVGTAIAGMQAAIADDGEVRLCGPTLMAGYDGEREQAGVGLDEDGWLSTGDLGTIDEGGFLSITGRKTDMIVTADGNKLSPEPIEQKLRTSNYISHALVHGDGRSFLAALITLDPEQIRAFAAEKRLAADDDRQLTQPPEVYALVDGIVQENNARLAPHEQIRKFAILDRDFSPEGGELTPTLKLRRRHTQEKHAALLESFYREAY